MAVQEYLAQARRDIDRKYDYRYSQLDMVFGTLLRESELKSLNSRALLKKSLPTFAVWHRSDDAQMRSSTHARPPACRSCAAGPYSYRNNTEFHGHLA